LFSYFTGRAVPLAGQINKTSQYLWARGAPNLTAKRGRAGWSIFVPFGAADLAVPSFSAPFCAEAVGFLIHLFDFKGETFYG
jgi:hypothetical protein